MPVDEEPCRGLWGAQNHCSKTDLISENGFGIRGKLNGTSREFPHTPVHALLPVSIGVVRLLY